MIKLRSLVYIRLGTQDLDEAEHFTTSIVGLEVAKRDQTNLYLRSNQRAYTLQYFKGNPREQFVGVELDNAVALAEAASALEASGIAVHRGTSEEASVRRVHDFISFKCPTGNIFELVVRPELSAKRYFPSRDAGIKGFNHIGLCSTDPVRDEQFWTSLFNVKVSDRISDIPLLRFTALHHELALVPSPGPGVQHINHQVETTDDVMRNYYFLRERNVPIVFGPGRHPTSGARFLYFTGPNGLVYEYSCGVDEIADETNHRPRQFAFEPTSFCQWGSKPSGFVKTGD